jgi:hypothetical protein
VGEASWNYQRPGILDDVAILQRLEIDVMDLTTHLVCPYLIWRRPSLETNRSGDTS